MTSASSDSEYASLDVKVLSFTCVSDIFRYEGVSQNFIEEVYRLCYCVSRSISDFEESIFMARLQKHINTLEDKSFCETMVGWAIDEIKNMKIKINDYKALGTGNFPFTYYGCANGNVVVIRDAAACQI